MFARILVIRKIFVSIHLSYKCSQSEFMLLARDIIRCVIVIIRILVMREKYFVRIHLSYKYSQSEFMLLAKRDIIRCYCSIVCKY